jgi:hypothetical protein
MSCCEASARKERAAGQNVMAEIEDFREASGDPSESAESDAPWKGSWPGRQRVSNRQKSAPRCLARSAHQVQSRPESIENPVEVAL